MSIFYNSHTRKPRIWVALTFIAVPIILIIVLLLGTKPFVQKSAPEQSVENETDIFAK